MIWSYAEEVVWRLGSPMMGGTMGGHGGRMGCCGEAGMGMGMGMPMDCPMMKGTTAQPATKPAN